MNVFDAFVAYQFIKILVTPWEETEAFKLGIIDEDGNNLKKARELKSGEEKKAYTIFHRLIFNVKRFLAKVPGGRSKLASYAAALALLKEECEENKVDFVLMENAFIRFMEQDSKQWLNEEVTVNAGSGNIAGIGVGDKGEPGVRTSKFAGHKVIHVDRDTFTKLVQGKRKNKHWSRYVKEDDPTGMAIKKHFRNSKKRLFMQLGDDGPIQEIVL